MQNWLDVIAYGWLFCCGVMRKPCTTEYRFVNYERVNFSKNTVQLILRGITCPYQAVWIQTKGGSGGREWGKPSTLVAPRERWEGSTGKPEHANGRWYIDRLASPVGEIVEGEGQSQGLQLNRGRERKEPRQLGMARQNEMLHWVSSWKGSGGEDGTSWRVRGGRLVQHVCCIGSLKWGDILYLCSLPARFCFCVWLKWFARSTETQEFLLTLKGVVLTSAT